MDNSSFANLIQDQNRNYWFFDWRNLAAESSHQQVKEKLRKQLNTWMIQQNDTEMEAELSVPLKARDMGILSNIDSNLDEPCIVLLI